MCDRTVLNLVCFQISSPGLTVVLLLVNVLMDRSRNGTVSYATFSHFCLAVGSHQSSSFSPTACLQFFHECYRWIRSSKLTPQPVLNSLIWSHLVSKVQNQKTSTCCSMDQFMSKREVLLGNLIPCCLMFRYLALASFIPQAICVTII